MPFIIETLADQTKSAINIDLLRTRLAPYKGEIEVIELSNCRIYHTKEMKMQNNNLLFTSNTQNGFYKIRIENNTLLIENDLLNCYPLWRTEFSGHQYIASEAKAFRAINNFNYQFKNIDFTQTKEKDFSPFNNISLCIDQNIKIDQGRVYYENRSSIDFSIKNNISSLAEYLYELKEKSPKKTSFTSLLSGGIDSSIATAMLRPAHSYTLATELGDELAGASSIANHLKVDLQTIHMSQDDLFKSIQKVVYDNEIFDGLSAEILGQIYYLSSQITEQYIMTGYGSDLLFDGMLRHKAYMEAVQAFTTQELIERTYWTGEMRPFCFTALDKRIYHFYWNQEFIQKVINLPSEKNYDGDHEKVLLRNSAIELDLLSKNMAFYPKKGLTDGSCAHILFSRSLNLSDNHNYIEKSKYCFELLQRRFNESI